MLDALKGLGLRKNPLVRQLLAAFNPDRTTVNGKTFYLDRYDNVLSKMVPKNEFEPCETKLITSLVKPGQTFVDVGANIGYYTIISLSLGARVIAFEPSPQSFAILKKNVQKNGYGDRTKLYKLAASDHKGQADLFLNDYNHGDNRLYAKPGMQKIQVALDTIDNIIPHGEKIDIIKMDIQGAECVALRGAKRVLAENPNLVLIFEFRPTALSALGGASADELFHILSGFKFFLIDEDSDSVTAMSQDEITRETEKPDFFTTNLLATRRSDIANLVHIAGGSR